MVYTVKIKPDIIDGDVSKVINANASDNAFSAGDILFDWQAIQVPKGTNKLISISGYLMGQDGGVQVNSDIEFVFAKTINGVAPTTLGEENAAQTACFELPLHFIGFAKVEGTSSATVGGEFGDYFTSNYGGANGGTLPLVLEGEPESGQNVGYDVIYVAAFTGSAVDFSTGVLKDGAETSDSATSLTTKTVDPRKAFNVGDTVYIHDVDTAIGTIASMTATNITLNAAIAGGTDIADEDEFVNATPITCIFGFER